MAKKQVIQEPKAVFKVDRVYYNGQEDVSYYVVALRIGSWTETINVPRPRGWFGLQKSNLSQLQSDIQNAKGKLLAKHQIFAEEFPEVEAYGQSRIEAEIRTNLDMPKLQEWSSNDQRSVLAD